MSANSIEKDSNSTLDKVGIACSVACAIHCAIPVLLSFASPSVSSFFGNEWIHIILLLVVIPIALFSFTKARTSHGQNSPLLLGVLGITLLIVAVLGKSYLNIENENFELVLTLVGSFVLVLGHILNLRLAKI